MRIYDLFHQIVEKFVPLDPQTKTELQSGAFKSYHDVLALAKKKKEAVDLAKSVNAALQPGQTPEIVPKFTIQERVILSCEQWWMRYIFAILFIYLVPRIKSYMNGERREVLEDEDDDDAYSQYQAFKRFQRGL